MRKKESVKDWWERVKDVQWHPDDHLMPYIEWSRGLEFYIHLDGTKKNV